MVLMFRCEKCGAAIDVRNLEPGEPIPCWQCGAAQKVPDEESAVGDPPMVRAWESSGTSRPPGAGRWPMFRALWPIFILFAWIQLVVGIAGAAVVMKKQPFLGFLLISSAVLAWLIYLGLSQGVRLLLEVWENTLRTKALVEARSQSSGS